MASIIKFLLQIGRHWSFGEESIPSVAVAGMGKDLTPPPSPEHLTATTIENKMVKLEWSQPACPDIKGYQISRAEDFEATLLPLHADLFTHQHTGVYWLHPESGTQQLLPGQCSGYRRQCKPLWEHLCILQRQHATSNTYPCLQDASTAPVWSPWNGIKWRIQHWLATGFTTPTAPNHTFIMRSGDLITDTFYQENYFKYLGVRESFTK